MALEHADNYTIYGTSTAPMLNGIYAEVPGLELATDPDGISSGRVAHLDANQSASFHWGHRYVLTSAQAKVGVCLRVWLPSLPTGSNGHCLPIQWRDAANAAMFTLKINNTGRIEGITGDYDGTISGTTTNPVVSATGWYHIEAELNNTANTVEVKVEGQSVLSLTGLTITSDVYQIFTGVRSTGTGASPEMNWKDYVVWNGAGSQNNTFLGSVLVTNLMTDSDISLNWTPSSGTTGYEILDNIPPVDGTYISAVTPPPSPYVGTLSNLPVDVTSVKGLITTVRAAKSDGGDGSLQVGIISDPTGTPTTGLGADRPITVAQTYWRDVFELDPDTSAAWLPAAVNVARLQINRTA